MKHLEKLTDKQLADEVLKLDDADLITASQAGDTWVEDARRRRAIINGERKRRDLDAQGEVLAQQVNDMLTNMTPEQREQVFALHRQVSVTPVADAK